MNEHEVPFSSDSSDPQPELAQEPERKEAERVQIIHIDAMGTEYQAGLKTFQGVEEKISQHPELQQLLQDYANGDAVVRGLHRFAVSSGQTEEVIREIEQQGSDRSEGLSVQTGEHFHVAASFMRDPWQGVMAYTTEFEGVKRPKEAEHSLGIFLVYDNSDGSVVYVDYETQKIYGKDAPTDHVIDMERRDNSMYAVIATRQDSPSMSWKERLRAIVVIEYPFIPRPEPKGVFGKFKQTILGRT